MSTTSQHPPTAPDPVSERVPGPVSKPARKRAFKARLPAEQRRALILTVALDAFAETGYELTSMGTIAAAADVARPVLYHYFPSKQALYLAILEDQGARIGDYIAQRVARHTDAANRIFAAADGYLSFAEQHPQAWTLLLDDSALTDPECAAGRRRIHDTVLHTGLAVLASDVPAAGTGTEITDPRVQLGMRFVLSGFNGVIQWWRDNPDITRPQILETLTDLIQSLANLSKAATEPTRASIQ